LEFKLQNRNRYCGKICWIYHHQCRSWSALLGNEILLGTFWNDTILHDWDQLEESKISSSQGSKKENSGRLL